MKLIWRRNLYKNVKTSCVKLAEEFSNGELLELLSDAQMIDSSRSLKLYETGQILYPQKMLCVRVVS